VAHDSDIRDSKVRYSIATWYGTLISRNPWSKYFRISAPMLQLTRAATLGSKLINWTMSINLTLDSIRSLYSHLPAYTRPTCHIAGTNGKGSVSALLSSILGASSLSVGRFNSPHLVSINDSIVINNEPVSPDVYGATRDEVELVNKKHGTGASSFELLTLTALVIFERAGLDVVVIEVGMGGRLDATNVIPDDCILVSALTTVDLDHVAFLGPTIADIAKEKAGIARRGKPFVLGHQTHSEVEDVVKHVVKEAGGYVVMAGGVEKSKPDRQGTDGFSLLPSDFKPPPSSVVRVSMPCFPDPVHARLPLYGDHQLANLSVATTMVSTILANPLWTSRHEITTYSISNGIESTIWPGRLSFHTLDLSKLDADEDTGPLIVLADGAHNPSSSSTLASYISHFLSGVSPNSSSSSESRPKTVSLTFILALSHSPPKSPYETLSPLLLAMSHILANMLIKLNIAVVGFTPPDGMPWVRPVPPNELKEVVLELVPETDVFCAKGTNQIEELKEVLRWAADMRDRWGKDGGLVVVAGSLYLVADFYRVLKGT
jgi:dihydrofolate synthase